MTLSSTKPTRAGYTFIGWSTSANATTAQYQPGGKYTANSGATLYAIWKRTDENLGTYKYSNPRKTTLYARISYSGTNKYITNISDNSNNDNTYKNVQLKNENGSLQQVWEFEKLSNGGYKISSVYDGRVLDIYQTKTINGTNIGACGTYYANDGQVWYLLKNNGKYVIQPKASTGVYLGVADTNDGGNVQVTTSAHLFNVEILKPVGKSTMKVVQEGTSVSPTKLSWTAATDATWYNLYVYDGEVWKSNCVYSKQKIKGLEWSFQLPPGTYQAHLSPINIHNWTNSNFVSFTIKENKYTINYNPNGGSGSISNQTKIYGQDLTLSSTKPTRAGYTFIGWSTSANATTAQYQPGGKYTANSGATLYAIWKRTDENLGTYKYSNPRKTTLYARISYSGTNKYITNISDNSNNDNTYKNVQLKNENGSLQQVWEFEKLSNGGYKISSVYDGRVLDIYQTKTINGTNIGACGTYYANDGQVWYLLKNNGKYVIQPKASTGVYLGVADTNDGGNVQVTTSAHLFNVEILKPVGKSTMKVVQEGTSVSPTKLSWTAATDATWYNLYVYDGEVWKSNCVYSKQKIKGLEWSFQLPPGTYQAHLSPINIHNWTNSNFVSFTIKENKYTINYNPNGGIGTMDTQTLIFGENFTIPENKFVKTGYDFCYFNVYRNSDGKWYTSENGWQTESEIKRLGYSKRNYNVGEKYTMSKNWTSDLSSDLSFTFYPVWREKQVTIKYDLNGGTGTISPTYKKLDIECTLSTTKPTKTDYTFAGWSADKNSTVAQYQPGEKYTGNKDVTLYAVWVSNQYTINISTTNCKVNITATFNGNRIEVSYGDKVPYGAKLSYEAQADYGYYFGVDLNNSNKAIISKTSEEIVVTDDVNIAEKAYLKNYRITAYTYAGGYSPIISNRDYAPYNTYITVTAGEAFEGYQFIGWYLNGQCVSTDKVYQVKMTSNISIYAKYKKIA